MLLFLFLLFLTFLFVLSEVLREKLSSLAALLTVLLRLFILLCTIVFFPLGWCSVTFKFEGFLCLLSFTFILTGYFYPCLFLPGKNIELDFIFLFDSS